MLKRYPNLLTTGPASINGEVQSVQLKEAQPFHMATGKGLPSSEKDGLPSTEKNDLTPEMREKLTVLGREIMKQWELEVESIEVVQGGQMALVWKVITTDGPVCLKRINRPEKKALFSVHAQNFLAEKGARVPSILITKEQNLYARHGPFLFVVYDWIEGRPFDLTVPEDVEWMMKGLAEYHLNSTGFRPPEGIPSASKLGQWPKHYTKRCSQMEAWKLIAETQPDEIFSKIYLEIADEFIESGKSVLSDLENSHYDEWVEACKREPTLCHQDYGTGNTILVDNEVWVIDLDTTAYDLPIRDLRKIIIPMISDAGTWQTELFDLMLNAYERGNPLNAEQKNVMYIDMMFPYEFYDIARDKFSLKNDVSSQALEETAAFERLKKEMITQKMDEGE